LALAIEEKKEKEFSKRKKQEEEEERYIIYLVRVAPQTREMQRTIEFTEQELVMVLSAFQIIKKVTMQVLDEEPGAWIQDEEKTSIYDSILQKVERALTKTTTPDMCIV
jgi:hypothetical protein